jgi:uncharacterized protein with NRDE domain
MCLAVWAIAQRARFPWVVASNRDEYHDRPTAPLAWWRPAPDGDEVLSGRDLLAGGTWLAVGRQGRLSLLTNVREPERFDPAAASRGTLVLEAVQREPKDMAWIQAAARQARNGYNLLVADLRKNEAVWSSNRATRPTLMGHGLHGMSNALLDTAWPKVVALKQRLAEAVACSADADDLIASALEALCARDVPLDEALPSTGISMALERLLAPAFIRIAGGESGLPRAYGTRCSTVVVVEAVADHRVVHVLERRYRVDGSVDGTRREKFELEGA